MIDPGFVATMATYNRWQNTSLFGAAETLTDADRRLDRGAFFGSIHRTLNHILWADELWLHRLIGRAPPPVPFHASADRCEAWDTLRTTRVALDAEIVAWADTVQPDWLAETPPGSTRARGFVVMHVFNHQTHHRGQVHAMLTAAGARPDDTDLLKMPSEP